MTSENLTDSPLKSCAVNRSSEATELSSIPNGMVDPSTSKSRPPCLRDVAIIESAPAQKTVKNTLPQSTSTLVTAVHAKEIAMHKRSILYKNIHNPTQRLKANTLLNHPLPNETTLRPWRDTDDFDKLAMAAVPLYWMGEKEGWELKAFTLVFNDQLSSRMDKDDAEAFKYARDQITRGIKRALGNGTHFLYGLEKAPTALADEKSRRRWHVHGLIVARTGFSAPGKTSLRKALQGIKGEADADLMFHRPKGGYERSARASAMSWSFYAGKNGLSVQINPALFDSYDLPSGKQTFISGPLKREAKRWHEGKIMGVTERTLRAESSDGLYELAELGLP